MFALAAMMLCLGGSPPLATSVDVNLGLANADAVVSAAKSRVLVRAVPLGGRAPDRVQPVEALATVPGKTVLTLARDVLWRLDISSVDWWGAPATLYVTPERATISIRLWPACILSGRFLPPDGEKVPTTAKVIFHPPARMERVAGRTVAIVPGGDPGGEVDCQIRDGRLGCAVPAAILDLKIRCRGFVSIFRWGRKLAPGPSGDLGDLPLVPGASVIGWVRAVDGPADPETCRVRISPAPAGQHETAEEAARFKSLAMTARISDRGFFTFEGLGAGDYTIEVSQQGYANATTGRITLMPRAETDIRDVLVLDRGVRLNVAVTPTRDPAGQPWRLTLDREGIIPGHFESVFEGECSNEGRLSTGELAPGRFVVTLWDSTHARVLQQRHELSAASAELALALKQIEVSGIVLLGRKPLGSKVWFGRRTGNVSVATETSSDGRFMVVLPRDGKWDVQITSETPRVDRVVRAIDVKADKDTQRAEVELRLPDARIVGSVVDEQGASVSAASVKIADLQAGSLVTLGSSQSGQFEACGLASGRYAVTAKDETPEGPRESPSRLVEITNDDEAPTIRLVLSRKRHLKGAVLGDGSPVAGARVLAYADLRAGVSLSSEDVVTGTSGEFELSLASGSNSLVAFAMAPGFSFRGFAVDLTQEPERVILNVTTMAGDVAVTLPQPVDLRDPTKPKWALWQDGVMLDPGMLLMWSQLVRQPQAPGAISPLFARLAPANYRACWFGTLDELMAAVRQAPDRGARCVDGFLSPGGQLRLDLSRFRK